MKSHGLFLLILTILTNKARADAEPGELEPAQIGKPFTMKEVRESEKKPDSGDGVGINRPDVEPGPDIEATSNAETGGTMFEDIEPWPQGKVPFILASHLTRKEREEIGRAMLNVEENSCVRFHPTMNQRQTFIYINGTDDPGCFVDKIGYHQGIPAFSPEGKYLGYKKNYTLVHLKKNDGSGSGCMHASVVTHELLHMLGFFHEQARTDRDMYVNYKKQNVQPAKTSQFELRMGSFANYETKQYDLGSIMHYRKNAFGIEDVLNPKTGRKEPRITLDPLQMGVDPGTTKVMSKLDAERLKSFYSNAGCPKNLSKPGAAWMNTA